MSPEEQVILAFTHAFHDIIQTLVEPGCDGWDGDMRLFGYAVNVNITVMERPDD